MAVDCTPLYAAATTCYNVISPRDCFCPNVLNNTCSAICRQRDQPAGYLHWVLGICANPISPWNSSDKGGVQFRMDWPDYQPLADTAYDNLFPWQWRIEFRADEVGGKNTSGKDRNNTTAAPSCPSYTAKLGVFAAVNATIIFVTLIFGRSDVMQFLTRNLLGRPGRWWWTVAFVNGIIAFGGNLIIAHMIRRTPGFANIDTTHLALLWIARPRLSWLAAFLVKFQMDKAIYFGVGASSALTEVILQAIGATYIGMTVHFAASRNYYRLHHLENIQRGYYASIMYSGALLWVISIGIALGICVSTFLGIGPIIAGVLTDVGKFLWQAVLSLGYRLAWICNICGIPLPQRRTDDPVELQSVRSSSKPSAVSHFRASVSETASLTRDRDVVSILLGVGLRLKDLNNLYFFGFLMSFPFTGQWLFWAGFVGLAGDR
ncbi:hypothetical protein GP486_007709 [Trichoglossum hirsutum]|uniref:Uncharacterized protein n=1 Tax=Trichoglossum hirsutum TaxID=265104 RepID=A0A9P8IHV7_9PEZI|nr:hypothetical protein GP486_007709 [Trichoglossum hirsutum]